MKGQEAQTDAYRPSRSGGWGAARSEYDGHSFLTTTPLLDGARYWLKNGANPDTPVVTRLVQRQQPLLAPQHHRRSCKIHS